jgi:DNA topoisomerase-1
MPDDAPDRLPPCPLCAGGMVRERQAAAGRKFYGCSRFPLCTFVATTRPVLERCPECSSPYLVERLVRGVRWVACPAVGCKYLRRVSQILDRSPRS